LSEEPPIAFTLLTQKEKITANCFLSKETVESLKTFLFTLQKKDNVYLFSSNGKSHVSDEAISKMLNRLAEKAQIDLNGKSLSFHCFRKMFLSASIDSGVGLVAGKLMCGKAVPKSDSTYLTTINLKQHFIQLKKFLAIRQTLEPGNESEKEIRILKEIVTNLQKNLSQQEKITQTITERNILVTKELEEMKKKLGEFMTLGEFIQSTGIPDESLAQITFDKMHRELLLIKRPADLRKKEEKP
jgi:hypothetical protein